jgi:hypothetical protein
LEHLGEQQLAQQQQEAAAAEAQREVWLHVWQQLAAAVYGRSGWDSAAVDTAAAAPTAEKGPLNGNRRSSVTSLAISSTSSSTSSSPTSEGRRKYPGPGVVVTGSDEHDNTTVEQFSTDISGSASAEWEARRTAGSSSIDNAAATASSRISSGNANAAAVQQRPVKPEPRGQTEQVTDYSSSQWQQQQQPAGGAAAEQPLCRAAAAAAENAAVQAAAAALAAECERLERANSSGKVPHLQQDSPGPQSNSSSDSSSNSAHTQLLRSSGGGGSATSSKRGLACASAFMSTDEVYATGAGRSVLSLVELCMAVQVIELSCGGTENIAVVEGFCLLPCGLVVHSQSTPSGLICRALPLTIC